MKVSEIVARARSIASLPNTKAIDHTDESGSVNESWRDIYARFLESSDDFFLRDVTIVITPAMLTGMNEYAVPLPSDFHRLRTVDWADSVGGVWREMDRFPLSMRNYQPAEPRYRFSDDHLWVIGQNVTQIRVRYYPPAASLTHPEPDLVYAPAITPDLFDLVISPVYAAWHNMGCYIDATGGANDIMAGSIDDNTVGAPVGLWPIANVLSNLVYYKGFLYWMEDVGAGVIDIYRAPTDFTTTPLVPVAVTVTGDITSFSVFRDHIYFCDAAGMNICDLDGAGVVLLLAAAGTWLSLAGGIVFYVDAANALRVIPSAALVLANVVACTSDGTNLYVLDTTGDLRRITLAGATVATSTVLRTDIEAIGPWAAHRIPIITDEGQQFLAASDYVDTDITYPSSVVTEIMEYQAAIDFRTKLGQDFSALLLRLGDPVANTGLWARLGKIVKRDDNQPERVKNSRRSGGAY